MASSLAICMSSVSRYFGRLCQNLVTNSAVRFGCLWLSFVVGCVNLPMAWSDEGMLPVSVIGNADLTQRGIHLQAQDIFDPGSVALVDGIVRVNGCTGSFVSSEGLILTNHHCAYRAIQSNSTAANDLLANGFIAKRRDEELPAIGYTVRITQSYQDVSADVLGAVTPNMDYLARTKAIEKQSRLLEQAAEAANPGLRAEVAEMFVGETYGLFLYIYLRDVRLVFAPPASVGNFGGETDNWHWPRHTGDFSFMRVYTAPNGEAADYSPDNVPYRPKRHLHVRSEGVDEGDTVMLLGYPGRTARHNTSDYLLMQRDVTLPSIVQSYQWQISLMEEAGRNDREIALKHSSRIKSLANVEKRSRGQLKGLRQAGIIERRQAEEKALQEFIEADNATQSMFGSLIPQIKLVYEEIRDNAELERAELDLVEACRTLSLAFGVYDAANQRLKPDVEREPSFTERNFDQTIQQWKLTRKDLDSKTDAKILAHLLERWRMAQVDAIVQQTTVDGLWGLPLETWPDSNNWERPEYLEEMLRMTVEALERSADPAMRWVVKRYPKLMEISESNKRRQGQLSALYGDLIRVKKMFLATQFVPDANGTLRLTSGTVKGFSPEDAVYKAPLTTLRGLLQKTTNEEPFVSPLEVLENIQAGERGGFESASLEDVPVNLLYDTDTTGGNSGSPIMDASGRLVGVNFDRAFEATINDFAWSPDYSRSIGVDIRYILWITGTVYKAEHLLREMEVGVETNTYLIFLTTGRSAEGLEREAIEQMQAQHLSNFRRLHSMGKLQAAGPIGDPNRVIRGMVHVRAKDPQELEELFSLDPFVKEGLLKVVGLPSGAEIGGFNSNFSISEMEEFSLVVFSSPDGSENIDPVVAQTSWEYLEKLRSPDRLRYATRSSAPATHAPYLGVAIFKKMNQDDLAGLLDDMPAVQQDVVEYAILPLYMSQGILDP